VSSSKLQSPGLLFLPQANSLKKDKRRSSYLS
jgi:hypothetical protein